MTNIALTVEQLRERGYRAVWDQHRREYQALDPNGNRIKFAHNQSAAWDACRKHAGAERFKL